MGLSLSAGPVHISLQVKTRELQIQATQDSFGESRGGAGEAVLLLNLLARGLGGSSKEMLNNSVEDERPMTPWRLTYRVFRWTTLVSGLITILLIAHKSPAPVVAYDSGAGDRLEAKLQQVANASALGMPQILRVDEAEVNSYLLSHLILKPSDAPAKPSEVTQVSAPAGSHEPSIEEVQSSVRDVKIKLFDDRVRAYIVFDFHGKDMSLQLEGRLRADNGYLRFEPTSGQLGALPIPQGSLESAVRKMFNSQENREKLRLPPDLRDLYIENGEIVVSYK